MQEHGDTYRNPHFPGICAAAAAALQVWLEKCIPDSHPEIMLRSQEEAEAATRQATEQEAASSSGRRGKGVAGRHAPTPSCAEAGGYEAGNSVRVLDLACGAGQRANSGLAEFSEKGVSW